MPAWPRRVACCSAIVLAALTAVPALAHDDKENAGDGGPTPGGLPFSNFNSFYMTLRGRLDLTQLNGATGETNPQMLASAWGWTDPLDGKEYALVCRRSDLAIVDVSNPDSPVLVGNVSRTAGTAATTWRDVRVVGNWAYIGVDAANHGIQAFDLTRVRGVVTPTVFTADAIFTGVTNSHSLAVNLNTSTPYVYAAGSNTSGLPTNTPGGLQVLNVSDPLNITTAASWQTDGYIHESTVFTYNGPDVAHVGKEVVFNCNGRSGTNNNNLSIVDFSDHANPVRLAEATYNPAGFGYTHQGYLTEDHRFFLINDELDETDSNPDLTEARTHVYDVSDLDNPVYKGFIAWGNGAIDHNLYIAGDFIYQANYTRGIRIFKLDDLDSLNPDDWLHEVAWLDTYPASEGATFNGAWQVYPYFDSGTIVVSDINGGLFLVNHVPEPAGLGVLAAGSLLLLRRRR